MSVKNFRGGWLVAVALCSCYAMPVFLCLLPNERNNPPVLTELKSESISAAFFHRMDSGALVCVHGERREEVDSKLGFDGGFFTLRVAKCFYLGKFSNRSQITVIFILLTTH